MLLTLSGCLLIDDETHTARVAELAADDTATSDTDTDEPTVPSDPPAIETVDPPFGTNAGGTMVTFTGGPFGEDPQVSFGGEAGIVRSVDGETMVVETPPFPNDGYVDLTVTTPGGETSKAGAFTYWNDATGQVGATGELVWYRYVGGYWDEDEGTGYGASVLRFTEGFDYQYYYFSAAELDTCTHWSDNVPEWVYDPVYTPIDALGGTVAQTSPSSTIALEWNVAEVRFVNRDLLENQVTPGETYDLSLRGTLGLPEIDLADVFPMPSEFVLTTPAIDSPTQPDVTVDHHFEWTTEEEGDAILLRIGMLKADGSGFEEELYCALADVGSFWMTPAMWDAWAADRQIHIIIGRYNSGNGLLPWNQGRIATASGLFYYGVGRSR